MWPCLAVSGKSNTTHPKRSLFQGKMSCLEWDPNPRLALYTLDRAVYQLSWLGPNLTSHSAPDGQANYEKASSTCTCTSTLQLQVHAHIIISCVEAHVDISQQPVTWVVGLGGQFRMECQAEVSPPQTLHYQWLYNSTIIPGETRSELERFTLCCTCSVLITIIDTVYHSIQVPYMPSLPPSLPHSLPPSLPHSLPPSLTPSLTHSLPPSLTPSLPPSLPHSLTERMLQRRSMGRTAVR